MEKNSKEINVLINAYACSPSWGSEQGIGWNWIVNLSSFCNLYIINEGEWKEEIEQEILKLPHKENIHFYYLPVSEKIRKMCWNQGNWLFYHYYRKWQKKALALAREIIEKQQIDVIHQLNMQCFREPGYLWNIKDKPFIWGPFGGMENMPVPYIRGVSFKYKLFVLLKNSLNNIQARCHPRVWKAIKKADVLIASGIGVQKKMNVIYKKEVLLINDTGCVVKPFPIRKQDWTNREEFHILWVGKFDFRKQLALALKTISTLKHLPGLKFHIIGSGSDTDVEMHREMAQKLGLNDCCIWHGQLSNVEVHELMQKADMFFFTSIMEATSTVIMEAISNCLPIVCFNTCGFGQVVDETIGRKVEISNPEQSVRDFSEQIEYLYRNRVVLAEMSNACLKRQIELSWDNKVEKMVEIYEHVLSQNRGI